MFLALKAIKEAPWVVTLFITTSVLKEIPARNTGCAVQPRLLPIQRTVASIPVTFMVVTLGITHFIPWMLLALQVGASAGSWSNNIILTVSSREIIGTVAAVLDWVSRVFLAGSSILAGPRTPLTLTVGTTEALLTLAIQVADSRLHTAASILAK